MLSEAGGTAACLAGSGVAVRAECEDGLLAESLSEREGGSECERGFCSLQASMGGGCVGGHGLGRRIAWRRGGCMRRCTATRVALAAPFAEPLSRGPRHLPAYGLGVHFPPDAFDFMHDHCSAALVWVLQEHAVLLLCPCVCTLSCALAAAPLAAACPKLSLLAGLLRVCSTNQPTSLWRLHSPLKQHCLYYLPADIACSALQPIYSVLAAHAAHPFSMCYCMMWSVRNHGTLACADPVPALCLRVSGCCISSCVVRSNPIHSVVAGRQLPDTLTPNSNSLCLECVSLDPYQPT
jgi:hypothetical protein